MPQIILWLLFLGLITSLALNFVLYRQGREYYLELNETRLDPLGLRYFPVDLSQPTVSFPKTRVLFFGDSRAAQWENPQGFEEIEFVNRGIGAQTTAQVLGRFSAHVAPLKPDLIVVQVGINDLKTIPLFPQRKAEIIANCKENIQQIVDQSLQGGASVLLTTIFPLGQLPLERRPFWSDDVALTIDDVNKFLFSLQSERVEILDTAPVLTNSSASFALVDAKYSLDFLHINQQGYAALNAELSHLLLEFK